MYAFYNMTSKLLAYKFSNSVKCRPFITCYSSILHTIFLYSQTQSWYTQFDKNLQGTGNQLTSKQCCDKYKNMLRSFKIWKTACMATGAATPNKLFYFDYMEEIVGGSHTITTPFLDDSEGSVSHFFSDAYKWKPMHLNLTIN